MSDRVWWVQREGEQLELDLLRGSAGNSNRTEQSSRDRSSFFFFFPLPHSSSFTVSEELGKNLWEKLARTEYVGHIRSGRASGSNISPQIQLKTKDGVGGGVRKVRGGRLEIISACLSRGRRDEWKMELDAAKMMLQSFRSHFIFQSLHLKGPSFSKSDWDLLWQWSHNVWHVYVHRSVVSYDQKLDRFFLKSWFILIYSTLTPFSIFRLAKTGFYTSLETCSSYLGHPPGNSTCKWKIIP